MIEATYCVTCGARLGEHTIRMHNLWHDRNDNRREWDRVGRQVDADLERFYAARTKRYAEADRKAGRK